MSILKRSKSEELAEQLHSTAIHLLRQLRRMDEATGTTAPRLSALSVIVFHGRITLGQLAEMEQVRPPTMTRIVNALEEQGLIRKSKDATDGRVIFISATMKGKRLLLAGRRRRVRLLADEIGRVDAAELGTLVAAMGTIRKLIDRMR
jgi:DNA-binding MarR family transcriptional regulator